MFIYDIYLLLLDLVDLLTIVISLTWQINVQTVSPDRETSNKAYIKANHLYHLFFFLTRKVHTILLAGV